MASSFTVCSQTHTHTLGPVHQKSLFPRCSEWQMTCHRAKRENILLQIERGGKWEIGNRGKKKREIAPLHQRGESFDVLEITEVHLHLHTWSHGHMYEHDSPCLCLCCCTCSFSLFHTYAKVLAYICTHTHRDHQNPGMRKAERLDQSWALVISFNWGKRAMGTKKHYDLFPVCTHCALIRHIHIISYWPESSNYIKSTFS